MAYSTFRKVRLFRKYHVKYLTVIHLATKPVRIQQGEVVFESGKVGTEMYIVTAGTLLSAYKGSQDQSRRKIEVNDTFGELCTLGLAERRQETVTCATLCDFLCLTKFDLFQTLGEAAPHVLTDMRQRTVRKYRRLHKNKDRRLSFTAPVAHLMKMAERKRERKMSGDRGTSIERLDSFGNDRREAFESQRAFESACGKGSSSKAVGFIPSLTRGESAATASNGLSRAMSNSSTLSQFDSVVYPSKSIDRLSSVGSVASKSDESQESFANARNETDDQRDSIPIRANRPSVSIEEMTSILISNRSVGSDSVTTHADGTTFLLASNGSAAPRLTPRGRSSSFSEEMIYATVRAPHNPSPIRPDPLEHKLDGFIEAQKEFNTNLMENIRQLQDAVLRRNEYGGHADE